MADVQAVFQLVLRVWQLAFVLFIFFGALLAVLGWRAQMVLARDAINPLRI